jgi:hypothetical protein
MTTTNHTIFRERAIQSYRRSREKHVLPRFVAPPVFLGLWMVLSLCLVAGWLAWNIRVPVYLAGSGLVVSGEAQVVLFISADQQQSVHPGEPVQVQLGRSGPLLQRTITTVVPTVLSPEQARQDYHLDGALALLVTAPTIAVMVALDPGSTFAGYAGSLVSAKVQVGDESLLSFVPLVGQLFEA